MDLPYSQQQQARRKNRSAANLQHLTLAPLTTRLPLRDDFDGSDIIDSNAYFTAASAAAAAAANGGGSNSSFARIPSSYIQGRSAPTTPRLLSKSPTASRSHSHEGGRRAQRAGGGGSSSSGSNKDHAKALAKSLSTTHLLSDARLHPHGPVAAAAAGARYHRRRKTDHHTHYHEGSSSDDWLFRAAVLVTSEARESKGQSWLTTRASSTSLSGLRNAEEAEDVAAFERELAREREYLDRIAGNSRRGSRRGSLEHDLTSPAGRAAAAAGMATSRSGSRLGSRANSRTTSRTHSRAGSRVQLFTPMEQRRSLDHNGVTATTWDPSSSTAAAAGYFDYGDVPEDDEYREGGSGGTAGGSITPAGPDFVNLDEKLEAIELHLRDTSVEDEDHIRRLVKREKAGGVMGSWLGSVFGWSLFSVQEAEGEGEVEEDGDDDDDSEEDGDEDDEDDDDDKEEDDGGGENNGDGALGERAGRDGEGTANNSRRRSRKRRVAVGWNRRGPAWSGRRRFEGDDADVAEDNVPPPPRGDEGTWQDAAWLLSVASKVIL